VAIGKRVEVRASVVAIAAGVDVFRIETTAGLEETGPFFGAQATREMASRTRREKRRILIICLLMSVISTSFLTRISY